MIAPRGSGWMPGPALRKRGVAASDGDSGWRPGFAHRERGVGVQHWLVSWRGAWVFLGLPGCPRGRQLDSHHGLVVVSRVLVLSRPHEWGKRFGWSCSPPDVSTSCLHIPDDNTTLGIELRLPPVLISRFLTSLEFKDICTSAPRFLSSLEFAEIYAIVLTCITNFISEKSCWRPRDLLLPEREVDWEPRCSSRLAWGMGSLRQRMIGLPSQGGLAARLAPPNSARAGTEIRGNFSNFVVFNWVEIPGFGTSSLDVYGRSRDKLRFRVKTCFLLIV